MRDQPQPSPTFGEVVRANRRSRNLGLQELADSCGINLGTLSQIENGLKRPPEIYPFVIGLALRLGFNRASPEFEQFISLAARERFKDPKIDLVAILQMQNIEQVNPLYDRALFGMSGFANSLLPSSLKISSTWPSYGTNPFIVLPIMAQIALSNVMSIIALGFAKTVTVGLKDGRSVTYGLDQESTNPLPDVDPEGDVHER